jgi:hypothetical protein
MERILGWYRISSSGLAVAALVVANLVPLAGVLFLDWSVWLILIVYWLENGIVGVVNVLKMRRAEGPIAPDDGGLGNGRPASTLAASSRIGFFVVHYGMFWLGHGLFVLLLPLFAMDADGTGPDMTTGIDPVGIGLAIFALAVSHGLSYWLNYLKGGEYRRTSAAAQMFAPYGRVVVLHVTIIFGAMAISLTGAPAAAVAILVGLKTAMDVAFHLREHREAGSRPATVSLRG